MNRSRLMRAPDHDLVDPARLRDQPCSYCQGTEWLLERSAIDPSAWRIRCAGATCGRVLVSTHIPQLPATGNPDLIPRRR